VVFALWGAMLSIQKHRRLLGEAIRAARKEAGFSQGKLAHASSTLSLPLSQ
jgi:DNA-binding transcriptional regulator YiaG